MNEQSGIHISYQLSREEIKSALRTSGVFHFSRLKMIVQTVVLGVAGLFFLLGYATAEKAYTENLIVAAVCVLLAAAVWFMPEYQLAARAKKLYTGQSVEAEIFPDVIKMGRGDGAWEIPLDGTSRYRKTDDLLMIITPEKRCAAFPVRAMSPAQADEIDARLTAGTDGPVLFT